MEEDREVTMFVHERLSYAVACRMLWYRQLPLRTEVQYLTWYSQCTVPFSTYMRTHVPNRSQYTRTCTSDPSGQWTTRPSSPSSPPPSFQSSLLLPPCCFDG